MVFLFLKSAKIVTQMEIGVLRMAIVVMVYNVIFSFIVKIVNQIGIGVFRMAIVAQVNVVSRGVINV